MLGLNSQIAGFSNGEKLEQSLPELSVHFQTLVESQTYESRLVGTAKSVPSGIAAMHFDPLTDLK